MDPGPGERHRSGRSTTRAWTRPGSRQSPADDDGMLPFDDLHFHRYCAVWPFHPDDDPALDPDGADPDHRPIRFLTGFARTGLRHTPWVILLLTVVFFLSAELVEPVQGVSVFLPQLDRIVWLASALGVLLYAVLLSLIIRIGIIDHRELYKAAIVYGLIAFLTVGTAVSVALVVTDHPLAAERNIVFTSGYLLTMLLGALLVYDGMLRTEHLFENLADAQIVTRPERYEAFRKRLAEDFSHAIIDTQLSVAGRTVDVRLRTVYVFSVLFVLPYVVTWSIGVGPQNLDFPVTLWGNVLVNVFVVAVFFQFLVLINRFYELVTEDLGGGERTLTYRPFHPDGHGGYRDFGKFATRVNVILILAGFYSVYRLVVQGARVTPAEMAPGFQPYVGSLIWTHSFVVPLVVYVLAAVGWFYYSFWQIHLRMIRERESSYMTHTESFDDARDWEIRLDGPAWPTDFNQLVSIVGGTVMPIILFLVELM